APASNPFVDGSDATRDEIWDYGLRNPWRMAFDRATGTLVLGDVGQECWEEVDAQAPEEPAGRDFGWPVVEGERCYRSGVCTAPPFCALSSYDSPVITYPHSIGCAIAGGVVYRGAVIPQLQGRYLYGDFCSGRIWEATPEAGQPWDHMQIAHTT